MKIFIRSLLLLFVLFRIIYPHPKKTVLFLIAPKDFRDEEFKIPYDYLKKSGHEIIVASLDTTQAIGMFGMKVKPTLKIKDADTNKFDCLVIVGGSGAKIFWDDTLVHKLIKHFSRPKKIVAAICISPLTLARAGILKNRKATVWKDAAIIKEFKRRGVNYLERDVVRNKNLLTASGPEASKKFASELGKMLAE